MTQDQLDAIRLQIKAFIEMAAGIGLAISPQLAGFILAGKVVAGKAPDVFEAIVKGFQGVEPSAADDQALLDDINALLQAQ